MSSKTTTVAAILQARMASTRLPGKVLQELVGRPMLEVIIRRLRPTRLIDVLIVATTSNSVDDVIASLAARLEVPCFRGSEDDVLDRYYRAACQVQPRTVVRLTADNPFVDASFVDYLVEEFQRGGDYVAPSCRFPLGLSAEVLTLAALQSAWEEDRDPRSREHVTPYIYHHPERFKVRRLEPSRDDGDLRLTIDTREDLDLARKVFSYFGHDHFSWQEAVAVLRMHRDWAELNRHVEQKTLA
jgi:spore coat polysaccharide biosynthesis protein SpsF